MAGLNSAQLAALEPLRTALVAGATSRADALRREADEGCRSVLAVAREQAAAMVTEARLQGRADAAAQIASDRLRARQDAQAIEFQARRAVYEQLRTEACAVVSRMLSDPSRHAALVALVRRQLGDGARVDDRPDGGAVAEAAGGRRIDASIASLVDAAMATVDMEALWAT